MSSESFAVQAVSLQLENVGYAYRTRGGPIQALASVDVRVSRGEFVCILGPSGCGKSTLLRLIAGLMRPSTGSIAVQGPDGSTSSDAGVVGWMAQRDGLLPWRTVLDNAALPLRLLGRDGRAATFRARQILHLVGLEGFADRYPHQLSGGMRQRAALARAIVHEPGLLLLDEPFAHLDELTRDELGDALVEVWQRQQPTVLMVTHSALEAVRLAQRVAIFSHRPARLVGDLPVDLPHPRSESQPSLLAVLQQVRAILQGQPPTNADFVDGLDGASRNGRGGASRTRRGSW